MHFGCIQEVRVWGLFGQVLRKLSHFLQVNTSTITCRGVYADQSFPGPFISLYLIILLISAVEFSGSCCNVVTTHEHSNLMNVVYTVLPSKTNCKPYEPMLPDSSQFFFLSFLSLREAVRERPTWSPRPSIRYVGSAIKLFVGFLWNSYIRPVFCADRVSGIFCIFLERFGKIRYRIFASNGLEGLLVVWKLLPWKACCSKGVIADPPACLTFFIRFG